MTGTTALYTFDVHRAMNRNSISIVKPTRCTNVSNLCYFGITLHVKFVVHLSAMAVFEAM